MELFKAIAKRHSYRGTYKDKPVPRGDLRKIIEAGIRAPSGYNGQTTSFVIVDDPGLLLEIGGIMANDQVKDAPALIAVVMDRDSAGRNLYFGVEDYSAAVENVLLAATALGYASVWIDGSLRREERAERIAARLGVPEGREVRVILPLGVSEEEHAQKEKKPFAERAWFNGFGKASE